MVRPTLDEYFTAMLTLVASRATCVRRKVGCIMVDKSGHIISTGYNGVPSGITHCEEERPCEGAADKKGDSSRCMAIHAEQNALMQAGSQLHRVETIYCSCTPCFSCAKMICNTKVRRIVVLEAYSDLLGMQLFQRKGLIVEVLNGKEAHA